MYEIKARSVDRKKADELLGIESWDTWGCGAETFDWSYSTSETCYILKGKADIITPDGATHIKAGMLVQFPASLECKWAVSEPIEKFYKFGDIVFPNI